MMSKHEFKGLLQGHGHSTGLTIEHYSVNQHICGPIIYCDFSESVSGFLYRDHPWEIKGDMLVINFKNNSRVNFKLGKEITQTKMNKIGMRKATENWDRKQEKYNG